jgi:hypothetical protein
MRLTKEIGMLVISATLAGCGGGGNSAPTGTATTLLSGGSTDTTTAPLRNGEGVYEGSLSNGMMHDTIVLEDGSYYTFYGTGATNAFVVKGSFQGTGTGVNGLFASTNLRDYMADGTTGSGSFAATYTAQQNFNGYVSEGNQPTVTFTGAALSATNYVYASAPVFSNVVGTWPMTSFTGAPTTVTVAGDNTFSGNSAGCNFAGTMSPRPSGKNIYNVTMTFAGAPCASPNQAATGIALDFSVPNGKRQLLIVGADSTRANGIVLIGTK